MRIVVSPWDCRSPYSSCTISSREIIAVHLSTKIIRSPESPKREVENA
jgi:hypothetical protein